MNILSVLPNVAVGDGPVTAQGSGNASELVGRKIRSDGQSQDAAGVNVHDQTHAADRLVCSVTDLASSRWATYWIVSSRVKDQVSSRHGRPDDARSWSRNRPSRHDP